jgi:hypothetical protein
MNLDAFIKADAKLSALREARRMRVEAEQTDRARCGNCQHWMKSRRCPKERNVAGMSRGPGAGAPACGQFALQPSVAALKAARLTAADAALADLS